jgi:hypothetical protein
MLHNGVELLSALSKRWRDGRVEIPRKVTPRQRELLQEFAGRKPLSQREPTAQDGTSADNKGASEGGKQKKSWFG